MSKMMLPNVTICLRNTGTTVTQNPTFERRAEGSKNDREERKRDGHHQHYYICLLF